MNLINEKSTFEAIFSAATLGIIVVDQAGEMLEVNPYAALLFGYTPSELLGHPVEILVPSAANAVHRTHRKAYMRNPRPRLMGEGRELFGLRKDGSEFSLEISLSHTLIEDRQVIIAFISDITNRLQTIEELKKSKERLDEAQALAHVGHFDWEVRSNKIKWSDEHYRIFGLKPQSLVIDYSKFLAFVAPEDVFRINRIVASFPVLPDREMIDFQILLPDKNRKFLQAKVEVHHNAAGELIRLSGTTQDVTEQTEKARYLLGLETAVENASIPIAFAELDNRISYVNQAFVEKWGYENKEEVLGLFPTELSASAEKAAEIMAILHKEGNWEGEDVAQKKDGTLFTVFVNTKLICDHQERPLRMMVTFVDISNLKEKEAALNQQKESAQTYLEMAGSIILVIDKHEKVTLVNWEGIRALGYPEEEIIGENWFERFIPKSDRDELRQVFHGILQEELSQLVHYENEIVSKEGEHKLIRWHNRVLTDENGHPVATISSGMDITQMRRIEKDLEESKAQLKYYAAELEQEVKRQTQNLAINQAKLKQANKLAKIGYWEMDLSDEPQVYWSDEYYHLFEVQQEIPASDRRYFLQFVHPDDREKVVKTTKKAIAEGKDVSFDYRIKTPTQQEKYLRTELHCQKNADGAVEKIFSVVQDFTEQKNAERQLKQALKKEQDVGLLKSRFVSMASHEFRTPLTSILASAGLIDMYRERGQLDKQIKHVERIKSSVDNLTAILNDFLSLEKLESGKIPFKVMPIDLRAFVTEVREEVSLIRPGQVIEHVHDGDNIAKIDPHIVKNILINLLSNAIKYSPEDKPVCLKTKKTTGLLQIQVIDQGMGIPEEDQQQLFSRFFRASNATTIQGTGLGLTIVKRYIDLMNGTISFISKENEGTTFSVDIPQT